MSEAFLQYQPGRHARTASQAASEQGRRERSCAPYRGYSKVRTSTALGSHGRAMSRGIGPPWGRCVSFILSHPCTPDRGASLIRKRPHPKEPLRTLGIGLW